ncbi:MAG: PASTA domain-containing protein [Pseudonocardiaceae bacterium]
MTAPAASPSSTSSVIKRPLHMRHGAALALITSTAALLLLVGCGGPSAAPPVATVTVQAPVPAAPAPAALAPAAPAAPSIVTLPDVVGQNGAIAEDTLRSLGLTKVQTAADATSGREVVLNPANWTVTKIEPKAGTQIRSDQTVVVTMTK